MKCWNISTHCNPAIVVRNYRNFRICDVEARLAQMDSMVRRETEAAAAAASPSVNSNVSNLSGCGCSISSRSNPETLSEESNSPVSHRTEPGSHERAPGRSHQPFGMANNQQQPRLQLQLLSQDQILPALDNYFRQHNFITPLFRKTEFMQMLHGWYSHRSLAKWAAVNIALALGYRMIEGLPMEDT